MLKNMVFRNKLTFFLYCRFAYIEFKTEADAEKTLEEKQGTEIDGRSISLYYTGEKGQSQDFRGGKNSTWSGKNLEASYKVQN